MSEEKKRRGSEAESESADSHNGSTPTAYRATSYQKLIAYHKIHPALKEGNLTLYMKAFSQNPRLSSLMKAQSSQKYRRAMKKKSPHNQISTF